MRLALNGHRGPLRVSLSDHTTFRIGGPAELWVCPDPQALAEATREPYRVIGAGSNLLVSSRGLSERVVKLAGEFAKGGPDGWVGAGATLPGVVHAAREAGLSGLEGLFGIPAVIGGAVRMNAGTRYGWMSDVLEEVEVWNGRTFERYPASEMAFGYRTSRLPPGVLTRARLALVPSNRDRVRQAMARVDQARKGQPTSPSAGCIFKNPVADSAGRLIDAAGLKGFRVGDAMVSPQHANFIVNLGGATSDQVLTLIHHVRDAVTVPLELEVEIWSDSEGRAA